MRRSHGLLTRRLFFIFFLFFCFLFFPRGEPSCCTEVLVDKIKCHKDIGEIRSVARSCVAAQEFFSFLPLCNTNLMRCLPRKSSPFRAVPT